MEILSKKNKIFSSILYYSLIIIDIVLITITLIFQIPNNIVVDIEYFDLFVCLILLGEYIFNLYRSSPKKKFILDPLNILDLIASIPIDYILIVILSVTIPGTIYLRYIKLIKLIKIIKIVFLSTRLSFIKDLFKKTELNKILGLLFVIILIFVLLFYIFVHYDFLDAVYFVIVTLTTVGYGDITPKTYNEKILSIILIGIGILAYSTITAAISSFFTERILNTDEEKIEEEINIVIEEKSEYIINELKNVRKENNELKDELNELKELIKK